MLEKTERLANNYCVAKGWKELFDEQGLEDHIDWSKAVIDSSSVRALFGGRKRAPIPRIVAKMGQKGILPVMAKASCLP